MFNKSIGRVLQPLKQIPNKSESNYSKASESKYDTEGEFSDSKTLEALEILKEEEFTQNWSSFRKSTLFYFNGFLHFTRKTARYHFCTLLKI